MYIAIWLFFAWLVLVVAIVLIFGAIERQKKDSLMDIKNRTWRDKA